MMLIEAKLKNDLKGFKDFKSGYALSSKLRFISKFVHGDTSPMSNKIKQKNRRLIKNA